MSELRFISVKAGRGLHPHKLSTRMYSSTEKPFLEIVSDIVKYKNEFSRNHVIEAEYQCDMMARLIVDGEIRYTYSVIGIYV